MPAIVTTNRLGDPERESDLRFRLEELFAEYPGEWNVSILGAQHNTIWEMKVTAPNGRAQWVHKLYGEDGGHNIATILTEVGKIAEGMQTTPIHERIRNLVGADCILGNEMKGCIIGVTPKVCGSDIETSISSSLFRIKLESGHAVELFGWTIAGIDRIY